jgi:hypothetical protein
MFEQSHLAASPERTFPLVMASDQGETRSRQIRWHVRYPTQAQQQALEALHADQVGNRVERVAVIDRLYQLVTELVAGWAGPVIEMPGGVELSRLLTPQEAWEIVYAALSRCHLTRPDQKNLPSPSPSATGGAAPGDAPA